MVNYVNINGTRERACTYIRDLRLLDGLSLVMDLTTLGTRDNYWNMNSRSINKEA